MKRILLITAITIFIITHTMAQSTSNPSATSGYAPVNGLKMYYEIYGEGEPLVLLHGSFMTISMNYGELIPELAKTNKVIAVELQGHGHTADIDRPFSYPNFAEDVAALLNHLKIDSANILGYSLGGTVGLQLALLHPEKVKRIAFISSVYKFEGWLPDTREMVTGMKPEFLTNTPLKTEYDKVAPDPSQWNDFITKMITFENTSYDLGLENIKKLSCPILIINGDYDGVDVTHSMELFKALGGGGTGVMEPLSESQFAMIPGTTHVTVMMQTNKLLEMIIPFLNKPESMEMTLTRTFDAPLQEVWAAWTDAEMIKKWWGPEGFTAPVAEVDFREGGSSLVCMSSPAYEEIYNTWTYTKIVPMERIEFVQHFTDKDRNPLDPAAIGMPAGIPKEVPHIIVFKGLGNGKTELSITEQGYTSAGVVEMSKAGMNQSLDKMAKAMQDL